MFLGDHWIGTEPFGKYFANIGLDAVVGSVGDGVTLRMISDIEGVKYTEGRLHNKFRAEFIACPFLKLFQYIRAYTGAVAKPFYVFFPFFLIESKCKLMEKSGKPHYVDIWVFFTPLFQFFLHIFLRLWLPYIILYILTGKKQ